MLLGRGEIQSEFGNPLEGEVIEFPGEKWRTEHDMIDAWNVVNTLGTEIANKLEELATDNMEVNVDPAIMFLRNRKGCSYPVDCPARRVCFKGDRVEKLIEIGEWKRREPHHSLEKEAFEGAGF